MYLGWSLYILYLHACLVRVTVDDSGLDNVIDNGLPPCREPEFLNPVKRRRQFLLA